jgi:hypothetical protein
LGIGAGASMGDINRPWIADYVNCGFAAVATDNGPRSPVAADARITRGADLQLPLSPTPVAQQQRQATFNRRVSQRSAQPR